MKKSTRNGIIAVAVVLALAGGIYLYTKKKKPLTAIDFANEIGSNPKSGVTNKAALATFGADYLQAWYSALQVGASVFTLNGKNYHTAGGTAV